MIRPLHLSYLSLTVAIIALSGAFTIAGFLWGILVNLIVGAIWVLAIWRKWRIGEILSLFFVILGISVAAMTDGSRFLLLVSTLATLAAWDLSTFAKRLIINDEIWDEDGLIRTHLLRLTSVLILGLTLPIAAFALTFELRFWQVFLLGAILLLGLSQVFSQLKRSNN